MGGLSDPVSRTLQVSDKEDFILDDGSCSAGFSVKAAVVLRGSVCFYVVSMCSMFSASCGDDVTGISDDVTAMTSCCQL